MAAAAQPLSHEEYTGLLTCLEGALDQNSGVQKQAESYISALEARPGFSSALAVSSLHRLGSANRSRYVDINSMNTQR